MSAKRHDSDRKEQTIRARHLNHSIRWRTRNLVSATKSQLVKWHHLVRLHVLWSYELTVERRGIPSPTHHSRHIDVARSFNFCLLCAKYDDDEGSWLAVAFVSAPRLQDCRVRLHTSKSPALLSIPLPCLPWPDPFFALHTRMGSFSFYFISS